MKVSHLHLENYPSMQHAVFTFDIGTTSLSVMRRLNAMLICWNFWQTINKADTYLLYYCYIQLSVWKWRFSHRQTYMSHFSRLKGYPDKDCSIFHSFDFKNIIKLIIVIIKIICKKCNVSTQAESEAPAVARSMMMEGDKRSVIRIVRISVDIWSGESLIWRAKLFQTLVTDS